MWWDDGKREATLLELTIPFDTLLEEAALRKKDKYAELVDSIKRVEYRGNLITIEVESRGIAGFSKLKDHFHLPKKP